jgi:cell division protein YceG involved in septum cleavage
VEKKTVNISFIVFIIVLLICSLLGLLYHRYTYKKMFKSDMTNAEEVRLSPPTPNNCP